MERFGEKAGPFFCAGICYTTYHKAQKKVNELMEKVFSGDSPVTVKVVCVQG